MIKLKIKIKYLKKYFSRLGEVEYRVLVSAFFLLVFGVIMVASASAYTGSFSEGKSQLIFALIGLAAMWGVSFFDYHLFSKWTEGIWLFVSLSVLLVLTPWGISSHGARRWVLLFGISYTPAELVKPAVILVSAVLILRLGNELSKLKKIILFFLPATIDFLLIWKVTNNLSTALIVFGIAAVMFYVAFPNKWIYAMLAAAVVLGVAFFIVCVWPTIRDMLQGTAQGDFRMRRILVWLFPNSFPDESRQSRYSMYAMGFGGFWGKGLGSGTVKYYLSEPANDFIFAVIAEELGIVGCAVLLFMYGYHILYILKVAFRAPDALGSYLALGVAIQVAIQTFLNVAVATSIFPNTGIGLPYVSSGGTALLIQMCEVGLVLNISRQSKRSPGRAAPLQTRIIDIKNAEQLTNRES